MNLTVLPSSRHLLSTQRYALRLREDLWMPLESTHPSWLEEAFQSRGLWFHKLSQQLQDNSLMVDGHLMKPVRQLGFFDGNALEGWTQEGQAMSHLAHGPTAGQTAVVGVVGDSFLNSYDASALDRLTGSMLSPLFKPQRGDRLTFLVGGGDLESAGVELIVDDRAVKSWHGVNTEVMHLVVQDLTAYAGHDCRVRVYDRTSEPWGHVVADHFMLVH